MTLIFPRLLQVETSTFLKYMRHLPDEAYNIRLERTIRLAAKQSVELHMYKIYRSAPTDTLDYRAIVHIEDSPSQFSDSPSQFKATTYFAWRNLDLKVQLGYRHLHLKIGNLRSPNYESNIRNIAHLEPTTVGTCENVALSFRPLTLAFQANYLDSQFSVVPPGG